LWSGGHARRPAGPTTGEVSINSTTTYCGARSAPPRWLLLSIEPFLGDLIYDRQLPPVRAVACCTSPFSLIIETDKVLLLHLHPDVNYKPACCTMK